MPQQLPSISPFRPALGSADFVVAARQPRCRGLDRSLARLAVARARDPWAEGLRQDASGACLAGAERRCVPDAATGGRPALPPPAARGTGMAKPRDWPETALLHLYNRCAKAGGHLLIAAGYPGALASTCPTSPRACRHPGSGVAAPDDDLLIAVMAKQFADRGLEVNEDVLRYVAAGSNVLRRRRGDGGRDRPRRFGGAAPGDLALVRTLVNSPSAPCGGRQGWGVCSARLFRLIADAMRA